MSLRRNNLTQEWDCPVCKERTVFKADPTMPPGSFDYFIKGYGRRHFCSKCGAEIGTVQVLISDLGEQLHKSESMRRTMEVQKKELESLREFKRAIEGELAKLASAYPVCLSPLNSLSESA